MPPLVRACYVVVESHFRHIAVIIHARRLLERHCGSIIVAGLHIALSEIEPCALRKVIVKFCKCGEFFGSRRVIAIGIVGNGKCVNSVRSGRTVNQRSVFFQENLCLLIVAEFEEA